MLARLLILAMLSGAAAAVAGLALGLPVWSVLPVYSLVGMAALLVGGVLAASYTAGREGKPAYDSARTESGRISLQR